QTQEVEFEQRGSMKRQYEYAGVEDGKLTRLVVDCTEDYEERKAPPNMEWTRTDSEMHGRKITLFMKDGQLAREGVEGLKEKDLKKLTLEDVDSKTLPEKPVAVGDTWEIKGEALKSFIAASDEIKDVTLKSKLTAIKEIDKRRCAVINSTLEMKGKAPNDIDFTGKMEVEFIVWIERGYLLSAKGKGKMTVKGGNDQFSMDGEGPISIETTVKVE
ncbi:MAG TPA: hypothetical protein VJU16_09495, partial [Planctomycetota bacterium]|nr:hypothetical protein [Planctomycetota bacterium]